MLTCALAALASAFSGAVVQNAVIRVSGAHELSASQARGCVYVIERNAQRASQLVGITPDGKRVVLARRLQPLTGPAADMVVRVGTDIKGRPVLWQERPNKWMDDKGRWLGFPDFSYSLIGIQLGFVFAVSDHTLQVGYTTQEWEPFDERTVRRLSFESVSAAWWPTVAPDRRAFACLAEDPKSPDGDSVVFAAGDDGGGWAPRRYGSFTVGGRRLRLGRNYVLGMAMVDHDSLALLTYAEAIPGAHPRAGTRASRSLWGYGPAAVLLVLSLSKGEARRVGDYVVDPLCFFSGMCLGPRPGTVAFLASSTKLVLAKVTGP